MTIDAVEPYSCPIKCMINTQVSNHNGRLLHLTSVPTSMTATSLLCVTMQPCKADKTLRLVINSHLSFINYGHEVSQDALVRRLIINACTDAHSSCQGQINRHACHKTALIPKQLVSISKTKMKTVNRVSLTNKQPQGHI